MQNKGAIRFFAIALAVVCLYQLSFTWVTKHVENKAKEISKGDQVKEKAYLDSVSGTVAYNIGVRKYTYNECKEREINLGLDLKGGMNVTLEVSVVDLLKAIAGNNNTDTKFLKAIALAQQKQKTSQEDFITLFGRAFKEIDPNAHLASIFATLENKDKVNFQSTDEEVLKFIGKEANDAIDNSFNIIRNRIDRFGVTQPNIQRLGTSGRILVELPGVKDPDRVRKLLQGTANLEFWETYENQEIGKSLMDANKIIKEMIELQAGISKEDSAKKDTSLLAAKDTTKKEESVLDKIEKSDTAKSAQDTSATARQKKGEKENPLFTYLMPRVSQDGKWLQGPSIGIAHYKDSSRINTYLNNSKIRNVFPADARFLWTVKPYGDTKEFYELIAIRVTNKDGKAPLSGDAVTNARAEFGSTGAKAEVSMSMNGDGAKTWARLTKENIGKSVAIVLDNYVYSYPTVNSEITGGRSSISGNFTINEAKDLANVLKSGKMPASAHILQEEVVGPSLGKESVDAGLWSFVIAFILVLAYMIFYYGKAGIVADIALFANMFFVFGILASLGAVLTLPGIAGIVLTIGMDVDKNVLIYERIREELRLGKGMRLAINDGYKHALSSIIDSNITTLLTGIVLYVFGSGPVQGFASTLIIGIISSMFCAIFITKLIFIWLLDKNKTITFWNNITKNILKNVSINFIGIRKKYYIISLALVVIGIASLATKGLNYGIDFLGGRSYVVRFDSNVSTTDIRVALGKMYDGKEPEVKTFGPENQVKITTPYLIDDKSTKADSIVDNKLYEGVKAFYKNQISSAEFLTLSDKKSMGKLSSQKVEPTIAFDLLIKAYYAVFFSLLIIFAYIAIRFKKWQWGFGGVVSLFHDTFIVLSIFSIFSGLLPFSLDIDQHFIAAILTIIGYSIMDSVIIFDRIREDISLYPKRDLRTNMNNAINSTLSRTLNTSGITFMVLLAMFIFGGEVIRGFCFALMIGIAVGTYSSVLNATPIAYDLILWAERRKAKKELELKK